MWLLYFWIAAQIIIEVLPISSSTHLRLLEQWFKHQFSWDIEQYFAHRNIAIKDVYYLLHIPTLLVVLLYFSPEWVNWFYQPALLIQIALRVFIAGLVTCAMYYFFKKNSISWPLIFGMSITMLALLATASCEPVSSTFEWSLVGAAFLGLMQGIALLPGISRLAFTTAGGCFLGFSLFHSFFVSWLIYLPIMAAAGGLSAIKLYQDGTLKELLNWRICLAMLVSGVMSWYVLRFVVGLLLTQKWWLLGWYMIIPTGLWVLLSKK